MKIGVNVGPAVLVAAAVWSSAGCGADEDGAGGSGGSPALGRVASADIEPSEGQTVAGNAVFAANGGKTTFVLQLEGLSPGEHAVHIHEHPDCAMNGMAAMGHWNPTMEEHGKWGVPPFHLGDIGNVTAGAEGRATLMFETDLWTVGDGAETDVTGHALMVHADPDDFTSQPAGNAGERIGCGVIRSE